MKIRRIKYKKNKLFKIDKQVRWTDIINCIVIAVTAAATIHYAGTTYKMLLMAQEPVVQIPKIVVESKKTNNPKLILQNSGFDITDVGFFEDYFVAWVTSNGEPAHQSFGDYIGYPSILDSRLNKGDSIYFSLKSFNVRNKEMSDFCDVAENKKEKVLVKIIRITVNFRREVDNREFSISESFNIVEKGEKVSLFPISKLRPGYTSLTMETLEKVRSELGIK